MGFAKKTRKAVIAATAAAALFGLTACQAAGDNAMVNTAAPVTWAIAGNNLDGGHMDPHRSQLDASAMLGRLVLDSLTYLDESGTLQPWLATSWETSADGKKVTFKLREDVTFTDGEKFNAAAVKANFEHIMAAETESAAANDMLGGDAFVGVNVIDEYTAEVEFNRPFAPFLTFSANSNLGFYSPRALATSADKLPAADPAAYIGTGPWKLVEYVAGSSIKYERNEAYTWYPEGFKPLEQNAKTLEVALVAEDNLRVARVSNGEALLASELSPVAVENSNLSVHKTPAPGMPYSLYVNTTQFGSDDKAVRKALALSVDREAIVDAVFGGSYDAAGAVFSPSTPLTTVGDTAVQHDVTAAAKLLDEAGWKLPEGKEIREKDGKPLTLSYISWTPRSEDKQAVTDLLVDQWRAVGIEVKNELLEPGDYNERYGAGTFNLTDWAYGSTDPDILRNHLHSEGFQNASFVKNSEIDAKLEAAAASSDDAERTKLYDELAAWVQTETPIIPVYTPAAISVSSDKLVGLHYDANGWPLLLSVAVK
ncbi:ABC transporter substrate-binding protein [Canibacter oris]|uniref:Peptide/nickel transport system substrate-binding protein n=1 Tax=Canibacter oris TaxID=1365628 RepID=A0A840DDY0_9MICO|nr:peptide/nickel transport system substrate-binding protein [Canibacter oris]